MIDRILDMWLAGKTAYEIGCDLGLIEATVKCIIETARRQRDPRAGLQRHPCGRFYGDQRAAQRAIVLWPNIRIIELPKRHWSKRQFKKYAATARSRQARAVEERFA